MHGNALNVTWDLNDAEYAAVLKQTAEKQYGYFVGHCADWGEVWVLAKDESNLAILDGDPPRLAVWPHQRYAEACLADGWEDRKAAAIEIHEFVDTTIAEALAAGHEIAVFPLPDGRYTPAAPRQLRSDLEAELGRIE